MCWHFFEFYADFVSPKIPIKSNLCKFDPLNWIIFYWLNIKISGTPKQKSMQRTFWGLCTQTRCLPSLEKVTGKQRVYHGKSKKSHKKMWLFIIIILLDYHQIIRHKMNYILENALLVPTKLNISLKKILNYFLLKKSRKR